jgi:hypothetical protein
MITVLYVEDCSSKYKTFKKRKKAMKFIRRVTGFSTRLQDTMYITGLVMGKYVDARLDYEEKHILKALKKNK